MVWLRLWLLLETKCSTKALALWKRYEPRVMVTCFALACSWPTEQMLSRYGWKVILDFQMRLQEIKIQKSICSADGTKGLLLFVIRAVICNNRENPCITSIWLRTPPVSGDWIVALTSTLRLRITTPLLRMWQVFPPQQTRFQGFSDFRTSGRSLTWKVYPSAK